MEYAKVIYIYIYTETHTHTYKYISQDVKFLAQIILEVLLAVGIIYEVSGSLKNLNSEKI